MPLIIRAAAAADINAVERWYEEQRPGLGEEFLGALAVTFASIAEHPLKHPVAHRDVRRALVHRFPYVVFFRVLGERVTVVGCFHGHRDPHSWRVRR